MTEERAPYIVDGRDVASGWTRAVPSEPGYYWMREEGDSSTTHVVELGAAGWFMHVGSGELIKASDCVNEGFEFWAAPIRPPED